MGTQPTPIAVDAHKQEQEATITANTLEDPAVGEQWLVFDMDGDLGEGLADTTELHGFTDPRKDCGTFSLMWVNVVALNEDSTYNVADIEEPTDNENGVPRRRFFCRWPDESVAVNK